MQVLLASASAGTPVAAFSLEMQDTEISKRFLCARSSFPAMQIRNPQTIRRENLIIDAFGAVAIANSIAYLSELLDPISIVLELTRRNLMKQSLAYVLWGQGEIGLTVYSILVRYWEFTKRTPACR